MTPIIASISATLPIFAVIIYFSLEKELSNNSIIVWKLYISGCLSTFIIAELHSYLSVFVPNDSDFLNIPYFALTEELCKFTLIYFFIRKTIETYSLKNLFFLGMVAALGFATLENIMYVSVWYKDVWLSTSIVRLLLTVPMHAITGGIIGMFIFVYLKSGREFENIVYGIGIGVLIHALFNIFASMTTLFSLVFMFLVVLSSIITAIYLYRKLPLLIDDIKRTSYYISPEKLESTNEEEIISESKEKITEPLNIISKEKEKNGFKIISRKKK